MNEWALVKDLETACKCSQFTIYKSYVIKNFWPWTGGHCTGPAHRNCCWNGVIVHLYCVCLMAFIGAIDWKRANLQATPEYFFSSFQPSIHHSFLAARATPLPAHFSFLFPSLRRQSITDVTSSPALPWHADPIWATDVHTRRRLCVGLKVLHYHDRHQANGRCARVCMCPVGKSPIILSAWLHLAFRLPWKCIIEIKTSSKHVSLTRKSVSNTGMQHTRWTFLKTDWRPEEGCSFFS